MVGRNSSSSLLLGSADEGLKIVAYFACYSNLALVPLIGCVSPSLSLPLLQKYCVVTTALSLSSTPSHATSRSLISHELL